MDESRIVLRSKIFAMPRILTLVFGAALLCFAGLTFLMQGIAPATILLVALGILGVFTSLTPKPTIVIEGSTLRIKRWRGDVEIPIMDIEHVSSLQPWGISTTPVLRGLMLEVSNKKIPIFLNELTSDERQILANKLAQNPKIAQSAELQALLHGEIYSRDILSSTPPVSNKARLIVAIIGLIFFAVLIASSLSSLIR